MDCWTPDPDQPQLLRWWEPLLAVARRARDEQILWPIHIDEFDLAGRTDRSRRPAVWVYRHRVSEQFLLADDFGRTYTFIPYASGPSRGRFKEIDVRAAVWAAGLPNGPEQVCYEYPDDRPEPWTDSEMLAAERLPQPPGPSSPVPRRSTGPRRRHLRLVSGDDAAGL